jgi:hypothetical protein
LQKRAMMMQEKATDDDEELTIATGKKGST